MWAMLIASLLAATTQSYSSLEERVSARFVGFSEDETSAAWVRRVELVRSERLLAAYEVITLVDTDTGKIRSRYRGERKSSGSELAQRFLRGAHAYKQSKSVTAWRRVESAARFTAFVVTPENPLVVKREDGTYGKTLDGQWVRLGPNGQRIRRSRSGHYVTRSSTEGFSVYRLSHRLAVARSRVGDARVDRVSARVFSEVFNTGFSSHY